MIRSFVGTICLTAFLLAACGGGEQNASRDGRGAQPLAGGSQSTPPTSGGPRASGRAAIQLSGSVSGSLGFQGMTCQPAGSANLLVSISGTLGSAQYTIDIGAPRPGTYQLSPDALATADLIETRPSFRKWSAGSQQPAGSGSLAIEPPSGRVDGELGGLQGAPGTVRVQSDWTCP